MAKGDQIQITIYSLLTNKITAVFTSRIPSNGSVAFLSSFRQIFFNMLLGASQGLMI